MKPIYRPKLAAVIIGLAAWLVIGLAWAALAVDLGLEWDAVTQYVDGSPIGNDLAGYQLYAGTAPTTLTRLATTDQTTITVTNVPLGVTYYAVTALSAAGNESEMSNIISWTNAVPASPTLIRIAAANSVTITTTVVVGFPQ